MSNGNGNGVNDWFAPGAQVNLPVLGRVATGDNRTTPQGRALGTVKSRTSRFISGSIAPGVTQPIPCSGSQFYVTAASRELIIRPSGGIANRYVQGTGLQLVEANAFDLLEITDDSAIVAAAFQIFVGFDQFIDNRIYLVNSLQPIVAKPTYPTASAANVIDITDVSGGAFADINGGNWYALSRVAIVIANTDAGVTLLLQNAATLVANGPSICAVYPQTTLRLDVSGNYRLSTGGGANINAIVSELYNAIPA